MHAIRNQCCQGTWGYYSLLSRGIECKCEVEETQKRKENTWKGVSVSQRDECEFARTTWGKEGGIENTTGVR